MSTSSGAAVALSFEAPAREIDGFASRRVLPAPQLRAVSHFVFLDHIGPARLPPGRGLDVRPHPHIGLATVTYLYDGEIVHRDSLGALQPIRPGAVNWMTAGRGIVHSERSGAEERARGPSLHGLQLWVALPLAHEEAEPSFRHHAAGTLPEVRERGALVRVLVGEALGVTSPVQSLAPIVYLDVALTAGAELTLEVPAPERALYVTDGVVRVGGEEAGVGRLVVLAPGAALKLGSREGARLALLGGEPLDAPRHVWWNLVSSSRERLEQAKRDWREHRFPVVPGDEMERIPLPE